MVSSRVAYRCYEHSISKAWTIIRRLYGAEAAELHAQELALRAWNRNEELSEELVRRLYPAILADYACKVQLRAAGEEEDWM